MKPEIKKRLKRTLILSLVALVIGAGLGWFQVKNENATTVQKESRITAMPGVQIGGNFELVDHNGNTVTQADYTSSYKLIYFGFTFCPAICPTELQKITRVMKDLGETAENIQPLFITVDPERDTVEVMGEYVTLFHPRLIGLTGSRAQIDDVLKNYRVFAKKVQDPEMSDYTMDHSSFIYLMGPDDQLISLYRIEDSATFMIDDIKKKLENF